MASRKQSPQETGRTSLIHARPVLPGQDSGRGEAIYAALCQDFAPKDAIEDCWLSDIAHLMARIEYLRTCVRGYFALQMNTLSDLHSTFHTAFSDDEQDLIAKLADRDFVCRPNEKQSVIDLRDRYLGYVYKKHSREIQVFDDMERNLLRERDRVIAHFERRRRDQLEIALEAARIPKRLPLQGPDRDALGNDSG